MDNWKPIELFTLITEQADPKLYCTDPNKNKKFKTVRSI